MPSTSPMPLGRLAVNHPDLSDNGAALDRRVIQLERIDAPRLRRLWDYYRNPRVLASRIDNNSARPYRQAQEWGLPSRITGDADDAEVTRKEVVIENDIGWRIDAMVDFLFGQPIVIGSTVADDARRERIDALLRAIFASNGGISFLQKLAVLGAVYGHVDVIVKYVGPSTATTIATSQAPPQPACDEQMLGDRAGAGDAEDLERDAALASMIRFEIVEPLRAVPILCAVDPAAVVAYGQHYHVPRIARRSVQATRGSSWLESFNPFKSRDVLAPDRTEDGLALGTRDRVSVLELISPTRWQRYEDGKLVDEGANSLGRLPLVHVQNTVVPFEYAGASDVEPLMPLQDELNTRLSDRAYRITMRSMKMFLGKGIDDFLATPVGPGKMFATDNVDASIQEFGGDTACPSEQNHIDEIREALDKASGVSPIAAGAIKGRIGRLSSAAALRVTLLALLSRTERKRTTYGPAIAQLCDLALAWLDRAGHFATTPAERRVNVYWPNPIAANEGEQLDTAKSKQELGIDPAQLTRELGY
jgi:hypothetical protein